jgi:hypothetical protein
MLAAIFVCASVSYEHVVIVPEWTEAPPESLAMFHGRYGIDTGRWWRAVHIPTLLFAIAAFLLLPSHPRRGFVGAAALGYDPRRRRRSPDGARLNRSGSPCSTLGCRVRDSG